MSSTTAWTEAGTAAGSGMEAELPSGTAGEPGRDCPRCPRLVAFRTAQRAAFPSWHNAPVPGFGPCDAPMAVVGLAPGLRGANRSGRPFTGDAAGEVLYPTLIAQGLAEGQFRGHPEDGLRPTRCRILNAVRCVPPANKPTPAEIRTCRDYLAADLRRHPPRVVLALGRIAYESVLRVYGASCARLPFTHGGAHRLERGPWVVGSYHTSRYNMNTGKLTTAMFEAAVAQAVRLLDGG